MLKLLDTIGIYSLSALPSSGIAGEVAYYNGVFYGWTGSAWKSLNNDATTKFDVGLGNVDNTSDLAKPVSTATQTALDTKVSKGIIGSSGLTATTAARIVGRRSDSSGTLEELTVGVGVTMRSTVIGLADIASGTFVGNSSASTGAPVAMSKATATSLINSFTTTLKGLVPAPGSSSGRYLKDDGTWSTVVASSTAASTSFNPVGNLSATDVQSALAELDTEKSATTHNHDGVYQPLDDQLIALAGLSYTGNGNEILRVNAAETGWELFSLLPFVGASSSADGIVGLVPAPLTGDQTRFLRGDGTWQTVITSTSAAGTSFTPYGNIVATDTQSAIQELDDEKVKMGPVVSSNLTMASGRFLGRYSSSTGSIQEMTSSVATGMLNTFSTVAKGLVPAPATASGRYLRDDGSWAIPTPDFDPVFATGTGLSQDIELPFSGLLPHQVLVFVNGLRFRSSEYTISGTTLNITTNAPDDDIEILRR